MTKLVLKKNKLEDISLFQKYLCDKELINRYPFIKNSIFRIFPDLGIKIENEKIKELNIISSFVEDLYDVNKNKINEIQKDIENQMILFSSVIYESISKIMSYNFEKDSVYEVYISLFPFSTYWKNKARVSILDDIWWYKKTPFIEIIIHELSHVVLKEQFKDEQINTSQFIFNILKEVFAPILLRSSLFKDIIYAEELKKGNPEIHYLKVKKNDKIYNIVDFFEEMYLKEINNGVNFLEIMKKIMYILKINESVLKEKDNIFKKTHKWEYMWSNEFKDKLKNASYFDPIILN